MKRKLLIILLALISTLCIALGLSACDFLDGENGIPGGITGGTSGGESGKKPDANELRFEYDSKTDSYICLGIEKNIDVTEITVPSQVDGKLVTAIGPHSFYSCEALESINIPETITSIGSGAFERCMRLKNITIPAAVTFIGDYAFSECTSLTEVYISDIKAWCNIDFYGENANPLQYTHKLYLNDNPLTEIDIPQEITEIKQYTFCGYSTLESVTIPDTVGSIGDYAFCGCNGITSLTIPDKVNSIGDYAFFGCGFTALTIPESVKHIGSGALYNCDKLETITLPFVGNGSDINELLYILERSNDSLKTVVVTGGNSIGDGAFSYFEGITSITLPESVTFIDNGAFFHCSNLTNVNIPEGVTSIGIQAFSNCSSLKSITIPEHITSIADEVFNNCSSLENLTIPNSVTSISTGAFSGCGNIKTATVPVWVLESGNIPRANLQTVVITGGETIGQEAFNYCKNLESVTIGESVTSIVDKAFLGSQNLQEITIANSDISIGELAFKNCTNIKTVTVPASAIRNIPKDSLQTVTITSGETIGADAFSKCSNLKNLTLPASVTSVEIHTFDDCARLESIEVDENNTVYASQNGILYNKAAGLITGFKYVPNAIKGSVIIPDGVKSITSNEFSERSGLENVTIPASVSSIYDLAFYGCTRLESITVDENNQNYSSGDGILYNKNKTELIKAPQTKISVTIPVSVTAMGDYAFSGCTHLKGVYITDLAAWCNIEFGSDSSNPLHYAHNLYLNNELVTELNIPKTVTEIKDRVFCGCRSIESINIHESVTSIGWFAFYNCTNLREATIPAGITSISNGLFSGCTNLEKVTLPDGVTSIGSNAFEGCSKLREITIPASVTSIGIYAFFGCTNLTNATFENTTGWKVSTSENMLNAENIALTDTVQNATYLKSKYSYYWKRG